VAPKSLRNTLTAFYRPYDAESCPNLQENYPKNAELPKSEWPSGVICHWSLSSQ
jgi:hypothetical protein